MKKAYSLLIVFQLKTLAFHIRHPQVHGLCVCIVDCDKSFVSNFPCR